MTRAAALALALAASAVACAADPSASAAPAAAPAVATSAATSAASMETGRKAYVSTCARCHGINLVSSSSAFYDLRTFPKTEKARFIDSVTNGKRQMPAWGSVMKPEAIESIWVYVGGVNGW